MAEFDEHVEKTDLPESDLVAREGEQLVAYLDGELDEETNRDIERRLSDDPEYRLRLQQLQQAPATTTPAPTNLNTPMASAHRGYQLPTPNTSNRTTRHHAIMG